LPQDRRGKFGYCQEKQRLTSRLLTAVNELTGLHSQQSQAVVDGSRDLPGFGLRLTLAQQKKDNAKYTLIEHVESHGCAEWGESTDLL